IASEEGHMTMIPLLSFSHQYLVDKGIVEEDMEEPEKDCGEWSYKIAQVDNTDESEVIIQDKDQKAVNKEKESNEGDQSDKTFNYKQALQKGIDEVNGDALKEWSLEKDHVN